MSNYNDPENDGSNEQPNIPAEPPIREWPQNTIEKGEKPGDDSEYMTK